MDLRKCYRVRGLDEQLEHCIHVSDRNKLQRYNRWMVDDNPNSGHRLKNEKSLMHGSVPSDDGRWFDDPYSSGHDFLMHYGVKGLKWGVITKEYEPVAVDHRKTGSSGGFFTRARARVQTRLAKERAGRQREYRETIENLQAKREKKENAVRFGGKMLGLGVLGIALYKGYKVSGIKPSKTFHNALKSLTAIKPTKARLGKLFSQGFTLATAREQNRNTGLARVLATFKRSGSILSLSHYRQKIKNARRYIDRLKNYRLNRI